jgi:SAM-dependent methyltransferase
MAESRFDAWSAGNAYQQYMGRWSGLIARDFLAWLDPPRDQRWLDLGCGTGQVTAAILRDCAPASVLGIDPSEGFVAFARAHIDDPRARFAVADAGAIPAEDGALDVACSGLVLNFIPDKPAALEGMRRVLRPGGLLAFYVWDYPGGGMGLIDAFWKAAARLDPAAADLDEARRFPMCTPDGLRDLCAAAGLPGVEIAALDRTSSFTDFDDFWRPFTLGSGPAPGYFKSLGAAAQARLTEALRAELGSTGPTRLPARAWAVRTAV